MTNNNQEQQAELTKYKFGSEELTNATEKPVFLVEGREVFKFENKKPYRVEIQLDKDIFSRETKFGIKFYVPVVINKTEYYWQSSPNTMRMLEDNTLDTNILNVVLDEKEKMFNIVPLVSE